MKKLLVSLLCVMMMVTFMPAMAWAEEVQNCPNGESCQDHEAAIGSTHYDILEEALEAAQDGSEVKLLKDIEISGSIIKATYTISRSITLNLNNHTINDKGATGAYPNIKVKAETGEIDVTIKNGTFNSEAGKRTAISISGNDTISLESVIINSEASIGLKFEQNPAAKVTIKDCKFNTGDSALYGDSLSNASINISNSEFVGQDPTKYVLALWGVFGAEFSLEVTESTIKSASSNTKACIYLSQADLAKEILLKNNVIISDGIAIGVPYTNKGKITLDGNTISGGIELSGAQGYETVIKSGFFNDNEPLKPGGTVPYGIKIYGGYFITSDATVAKYAESSGCKLIETTDGYKSQYPYMVWNDNYVCKIGDNYYTNLATAIEEANGAQISLLSDVTMDELYNNLNGNGHTITLSESKDSLLKTDVNIQNATIICQNETIYNASISDGKFTGGKPGKEAEDIKQFLIDNMASDYFMDDTTFDVLPKSAFQARIGNYGYKILANAISAATSNDKLEQENETITLLRDINDNIHIYYPNSCLILDLNGYTLTGTPDYGIIVSYTGDFQYYPNGAKITIMNGTIKGNSYGIVTNGMVSNVELTLKNVHVESTSVSGHGIFFPSQGDSKLTIKDSTVAGATGIGIKGGTLTVSGSSRVEATGEKITPGSSTPSGITSTGDAIYVEGGYDFPININLVDGVFISENGESVNMLFFDEEAAPPQTTITGGAYSTFPKDYIQDDVVAVGIDDATSGETLYCIGKTVDEKLSSLQSGDTVTILQAPNNQDITIPVDNVNVKNDTGNEITITDRYGNQQTIAKDSEAVVGDNSGNTGGTTPTTQHPTIEADDHATVSLSAYGTIATIKVAEGYELVDVELNGTSLGKVTTVTGLKTGDKLVVTTISKKELEEQEYNEYLKNGVQNTTIKATSRAKKGKMMIDWKKSPGFKVDGYEFFRTTKKDKYAETPFFKTSNTKAKGTYTNNKQLKKGTRYYYKMRGFRTIDGELVYTQWSTIATRTAK